MEEFIMTIYLSTVRTLFMYVNIIFFTIYMQEVLDKEGDNKYSAFVYYALAHFLEVEEKDEQEAWKLYHHMGKIAPQSYRMLFKRATELFHQKKSPDWCNEFFRFIS